MNVFRRTATAVAVIGALVAGATTLSAHMKVEKSEPAANATVTMPLKQIQIFFSEVPDAKVSKVEVKGPSAATKVSAVHVMDKSLMAMIEGDAPAGSYTVSWQSAGGDGHVQKGEFAFTLKK